MTPYEQKAFAPSTPEQPDASPSLSRLTELVNMYGDLRLLKGSGGHIDLLKHISEGGKHQELLSRDKRSLLDTVKEIESYLDAHPNEIIPSKPTPTLDDLEKFLDDLHDLQTGDIDLAIDQLKEVIAIAQEETTASDGAEETEG